MKVRSIILLVVVASVLAFSETVSAAPQKASCSVSPSTASAGSTTTLTVTGASGVLSVRQFKDGSLFSSTTTESSSVSLTAPPTSGAVAVEVYSLTPRGNNPGGSTLYRDKLIATCGYVVT